MAESPASSNSPVRRDHGFHELRVARVVPETADAASIVLDVPAGLAESYAYEPGQFCTFKVEVDGATLMRCYSMSSAPVTDEDLQVTVKRVPGGAVSNWLLDNVESDSTLEVTLPAGVFTLASDETELVAFAGGSGITPIHSLVKTALHTTDRRVRLLYANRDADSVIFAEEIDRLVAEFPERLEVVHHHDVDGGFLDVHQVQTFLGAPEPGAGHYLCGPTPFMDVVEEALRDAGVADERIHLERFTPAEPGDEPPAEEVVADDAETCVVTIELDGRTESGEHHAGATILQTARQFGMQPPFSCESGSCATCMGRLLEGTVDMHVNNALDDDEVEEGFILTCQSVPTSVEVSVRYGFD